MVGLKKNHFSIIKWLKFQFLVLKYKILNKLREPIYYKGSHLITGLPGTGKTLLASLLIDELATAEKPALVNIDEFDPEKTIVFDVAKCFGNGKQIRRFPPSRIMVFDEVNLQFNRRLNGSSRYNDLFIGLIEMVVEHRHEHIDRIYFLGQSESLQDTQLSSLVKYVHFVSSVKKPSYYFYKKNNTIEYIPRILKVESYFKKNKDLIPIGTTKIKIIPQMLMNYNTYGFADRYKKLPFYDE